jgi:thymidylate synthase (FAD)
MKVLDKGSIELLDYCASDLSVVNAARVSFGVQVEEMTDKDVGLIRYLMRERHGTPFEQGYFRFRVKAPLFVFREWHRHRVGHSYNEISGRYTELPEEFYIPEVGTVLGQVGKPGHYTYEPVDKSLDEEFRDNLQRQSQLSFDWYKWALNEGVSKQQARLFLPVNTYSEMIWSCNPRSLMHFLSLRNAENAQYEIRQYAQVAEELFKDIMPITADAFIEFGRRIS